MILNDDIDYVIKEDDLLLTMGNFGFKYWNNESKLIMSYNHNTLNYCYNFTDDPYKTENNIIISIYNFIVEGTNLYGLAYYINNELLYKTKVMHNKVFNKSLAEMGSIVKDMGMDNFIKNMKILVTKINEEKRNEDKKPK